MGMIIQNGKIYSGNAERGYREVTLWTGSETPTTSGTDITLSDSIYNYDEIIFSIISQDNETAQENFRVSDLTIGSLYIQLAYHTNYFGVYWLFTSDTSINIKRISSNNQAAITYLKIIGIRYSEVVAGTSFHKYSTTERVVGEWIDGKPIYEKTIPFTTPNSNAYTSVSTGVTNADKAWIDATATFVMTTYVQVAMIGSYISNPGGDQFVGLITNISGTLTFDYRVGSNFQGGRQGYATIRYTKLSS